MSITDELRAWVRDGKGSLLAIADRIDAEHQKAVEEIKAKCGNMWLKGYAVCHAELMEGHPVIAADLEKAGWVRLPVDADGEHIHIGDEMEGVDKYDSLKKVNGKVITISFESDGITDVAIRAWGSDGKSWHRAYLDPDASVYRHYHAQTVEGVLRDFGADIAHALDADPDATVPEATIAKYAAKLRLADDGKEQ